MGLMVMMVVVMMLMVMIGVCDHVACQGFACDGFEARNRGITTLVLARREVVRCITASC